MIFEARPRVKLVGEDGNAISIMNRCIRAARKAGWNEDRINTILIKMQSSDYDHMLQVILSEFDCYGEDEDAREEEIKYNEALWEDDDTQST